jgi:hypothetical protein
MASVLAEAPTISLRPSLPYYLPAGTTQLAGWELHALKIHAF